MSVLKMLRRFACPVVLSVLSLSATCTHVQAATRYFDINGTTAGSGVATGGNYSWEDPSWNAAVAAGTGPTTAWTEGDFPRFSAGNDGNAKTYTVTASANHTFAGMFANTNSAGTVHVATTGGAVLTVAAGLQGLFAGTNANLYIDTAIAGADATSALQWSGGGGSAFLYGANTFQGGVSLNTGNGLNFNNAQSFGAGPITYSATATSVVLANPDVGNFTVANSVTMPNQTTANRTMTYTGKDPVTFTNWTLGTSPAGIQPTIANVLVIANTAFPVAKLILDNLKGSPSSNLTVGTPAGFNGTLILTGNSTYGGAANGGITTLGQVTGTLAAPLAPIASTPTLQADDGTGLPTNSVLQFNGGVLQTHGTFSRHLLAGFGSNVVIWGWPTNDITGQTQTAPGGGGFSAVGSQLTVNINGDNSLLGWGDVASDFGNKLLGPLKFGSVSSNAKTLWVNPIDLNPGGVASPARVITVTAGTTVAGGGPGDFTEMSGIISSSADPGGTPATLTKNGTGILVLSGQNTYAGATTVAAGTLSVANIGLTTDASSNVGLNSTVHLGATTVAGVLKYTGSGEISDKTIDLSGTTGGATIDQSGTGLLKFTSNLTTTGAGAKTLTLQGSTLGTAEFDGTIVDSSAATAVTKAGTGTWALPNANLYSGTTTISAGTLILGNKASLGTGTIAANTATISASADLSGANAIGNATVNFGGNPTFSGSNNIEFTGTATATGSRTLTNNLTSATLKLSGPVNLSSNATNNTVTFAGAGNTLVSGVIANGGTATLAKITKSGSGTLTVSNTNTYAGGTTVSAGVLTVSGASATLGAGDVTVLGATAGTSLVIQSGVANAIADAKSLSLAGGGTAGVPDQGFADLGAGINETIASLILNGITQAAGTYGGTGSSATNILPEYFAADTGIITVPSVGVLGDFNNDGKVDAGDYATWRKNDGPNATLPNDNGLTTQADRFTLWRANFGNPPGAGTGGGLDTNGGTVPEPSSFALLMLGLAAVAARRRGR